MTQHEKLIATLRASAAVMPSDAAVAVQYNRAANALEALALEIEGLKAELARAHAMTGLIREGLKTMAPATESKGESP